MSSTIDKVSPYVTGTSSIPVKPQYAFGSTQLPDWLPSDYVFIGGRLEVNPATDYDLNRLLVGKVPESSSRAQRLFHTYSDAVAGSTQDGWLSTADPYFSNAGIPVLVTAILGYAVGTNSDLKAMWPKDQESLDATTVLLLKDGEPVDSSSYAVNIYGLWWISDSYSDLPLSIYTGEDSIYSLSITKTASAEQQLNSVEIFDTKLIDPVVGTDTLSLDILNTGADRCDATPKVLNLFSNQTSVVKLQPYDRNGRSIDLSDQSVIPVFTIREDRVSRTLTGRYDCVREDGVFKTTLVLSQPGVYVAQLLLFSPDGQTLLHATDYYVAVQPSGAYGGSVSIPEIRYHMMDACAQKNELLDAFEFSDADIVNAIHSCLEFFNGSMGSGKTMSYTSINFPPDGRYFLKQGVAAALMRSKAMLMARNSLPYNAGGVTIDDQDKYKLYLSIAAELDQDWRTYVGRRHSYTSMKRSFISV